MAKNKDTRNLTQKEQDEVRKQVICEILKGESCSTASIKYSVNYSTVLRWLKTYQSQGNSALVSMQRGRPSGKGKLSKLEIIQMISSLSNNYPDIFGLNHLLWSREAIRDYIEQIYGTVVSLASVSRYMQRVGMPSIDPVCWYRNRHSLAVQSWLVSSYIAIHRNAKSSKSIIYWCGVLPFGNNFVVEDEILKDKLYSLKLLYGITNQSHLIFSIYSVIDVDAIIEFIYRIQDRDGRNVSLIFEDYPIYRSEKIINYIDSNDLNIKLFYMPII